MKKRLLLLLVLSPMRYPTLAQPSAQASEVLEHISRPAAFQATFIYTSGTLHHAEAPEEVPGKVLVKDNKYHLTLGEQIVINNGETVWTYLPEANEVHITCYDADQETLNPAQLLRIDQQGFLPIALRTQAIHDCLCDVVDLVATDKENGLMKLCLAIEQKTKHLKSLTAWDSNDTWHMFLLTTFEPDVKLDEACFEFDQQLYDVEVIDLR